MCIHMFAVCPPVFRYPRHSAVLQGLDHTFGVSPANTNSSAWQPECLQPEGHFRCAKLYNYVYVYIYVYRYMKQVTSMFHCFVTYMLRINPSPQPKTRWFTSLAPASSQLKEWTRHSLERTCKLLFPASCPEGIPPHSHQTKGWHISVYISIKK